MTKRTLDHDGFAVPPAISEMAKHVAALLIALLCFSVPARAQTRDGGLAGVASPPARRSSKGRPRPPASIGLKRQNACPPTNTHPSRRHDSLAYCDAVY